MGWLTWEPAKYRLYASLGFLLFAWTVSIVMHDQHDVRPSAHHSETAHIWAYARDGAHVLRPLLVKLHIPVEDLASFFVLSPVLYGMKQVAPTELNCIAVIKREPDAGPDERYKRLVVWDDLYAVWNRTAGPWLRLEREPLRGLLGAHISTTVAREIARAGITEHLYDSLPSLPLLTRSLCSVRCWLMTAAGYEALLAQSLLPVVETVFLPVANRWVDRHTYQPFACDPTLSVIINMHFIPRYVAASHASLTVWTGCACSARWWRCRSGAGRRPRRRSSGTGAPWATAHSSASSASCSRRSECSPSVRALEPYSLVGLSDVLRSAAAGDDGAHRELHRRGALRAASGEREAGRVGAI